jgi:hypothetical protein
MRRAFSAVKLGSWHCSSTLAAQRAGFSSGLPRLALAQQALVTEDPNNDLKQRSFVKSQPKLRLKPKSKPPKSSPLMPTPQSSSRDGARTRSASSSNKRGAPRGGSKKIVASSQPLPEQMEGGLHDMAFVQATYSKDGSLKLQKKYLDTPKDQLQNYVKVVYAKSLDASYREGHIGRAKMFRLVHNQVLCGVFHSYVGRPWSLMKPSASLVKATLPLKRRH